MTETARELIAMLTILKTNSGNLKIIQSLDKDFTIVKDCKKESFDFVIDQAIAYIHDPLNLLYHDKDSVKDPEEGEA